MDDFEKADAREQWRLAKKFAKSYSIGESLKEVGASSSFVKEREKITVGIKEKLNNVGNLLIPHALEYEKSRGIRAAMISITSLGSLLDGVRNLDAFYKGAGPDGHFIKTPFWKKELDDLWKKFRDGLEEGDKSVVTGALEEILGLISQDLLWTKLPEIPDFNPEDVFK